MLMSGVGHYDALTRHTFVHMNKVRVIFHWHSNCAKETNWRLFA